MPSFRPLVALALLAAGLAACTADTRPAAGPMGMRASPPPDLISPGNAGAGGGRERFFDSNRGAPL